MAVVVVLIQGHHLGGGLDDRLSGEVLQQVQLVDTQIGQRAHGRLVFVEEPGVSVGGPSLGAGVADGGAEGNDIADDAVLQQLLGPAVHGVKAHIVAHHEVLAVKLGSRHHGLALRQGHSHGLFHQHVLAGIQGGIGDLGMIPVFHAYGYRIDLWVIEQLKIGFIHFSAVFFRHLPGPVDVFIVVAHQLGIGIGAVLRQVPKLGDLAAANNTDFNHSNASL